MVEQHWNQVTRTLEIRLHGFFSVDDVKACNQAVRGTVARLVDPARPFCLLFDFSKWPIQSREVAGALRRIFVDKPLMARRVTIVAGGALASLQVRRILQRDGLAFFTSIEDAHAWLAEDSAALRKSKMAQDGRRAA